MAFSAASACDAQREWDAKRSGVHTMGALLSATKLGTFTNNPNIDEVTDAHYYGSKVVQLAGFDE
eukprot:4127162-Amphidinium_carterae.1